MSIQKALPELPSEVWSDIFDKVGPTEHIPCVCRYFKELYTTRVIRWAERIVDHLEDCYKEQSPARGIPRGSVVTYDQANGIIKYFKNKINAVRSQLSSDEQDRCKISLAVHPESLSTLLSMIDEAELVNLLHDEFPDHLITAPRSEKMRALTALTLLDLSHNQLTALPNSTGNLTALTKLHLFGNQLTTLPASIGNLTALTKLDLHGNPFTTLPDSIGNLTALTKLDLHGYTLTTLPASIGNLTALTKLDLHGNPFTTLPDSIGNLTALTQLYLSHNQLTSLPTSIGNLTALTMLSLSHNKLTILPVSIGNLTQLTQLDLSHNKLTTLPASIGNLTAFTRLCLFHNQLTTLPDSIGNLTALQWLDIRDNPSLARSPQSLIQLRRLRENGCKIECDAVVDSAIHTLFEIPGEPPAKQQKTLTQ